MEAAPANQSLFPKLLNPIQFFFFLVEHHCSLLLVIVTINSRHFCFLTMCQALFSMRFLRFCELIPATHPTLKSEKLPSHPQIQPVPETPDTPTPLTNAFRPTSKSIPGSSPNTKPSTPLILQGPCEAQYRPSTQRFQPGPNLVTSMPWFSPNF